MGVRFKYIMLIVNDLVYSLKKTSPILIEVVLERRYMP